MDSGSEDSDLVGHQDPSFSRAVRRDSGQGGGGGGGRGRGRGQGARSAEVLRRGHSDGDVLNRNPGSFNEQLLGNGETWIDFLRHSGSGRDQQERARATMMSADRRRRLAEQQEHITRRRSSSNVLFGQHANGRPRFAMPYPANDHSLPSPPTIPGSTDRSSGQRILDRPLPRRPSNGAQPVRRGESVRLPKWQLDGKVTKCPICGIQFNFWYRKHHCRKCGRVVCANCSPHRITIPRQYIVHPPDQDSSTDTGTRSGIQVVDLTGDDESGDNPPQLPRQRDRSQSHDSRIDSALGGGQEVRLCNPCVPDPNPLPHLYPSPAGLSINSYARPDIINQGPANSIAPPRTSSMQNRAPPVPPRASSNAPSYGLRINPGPEPTVSHASVSSSRFPNHLHAYGSAPDGSLHDRHLAALLREHPSTRHRHRHRASAGNYPDPEWRNLREIPVTQPRPVPHPQLREEDECPICHSALPPKGPDGSETTREQHVTECIESHFSSSGPRTTRPPAQTAIQAAVAASAATPAQASGIASSASGSGGLPPPSVAQRRRTTGMVVYHASEKDCVGEDGEGSQECVICFEEFAVGEEMGRLECLCKFHKICIRQWWDTKGPGSCPVHQGGL